MTDGQLLHVQLKDSILAGIANGDYEPHEQLPSQRALCKQFSMSHMTVRRAINELVQDGIIYAIPGKGIFVSPHRRWWNTIRYRALQRSLPALAWRPQPEYWMPKSLRRRP